MSPVVQEPKVADPKIPNPVAAIATRSGAFAGDWFRFLRDAAFLPSQHRRSVRSYGAVGDGIADDTNAIATAVADAAQFGFELYWPDGDFVSTSSIPNLHTVRHRGPGAILVGSVRFYPHPETGQTNTLYCDPSGSDTNDGLSTARPFREIRTAIAILGNYGPSIDGSWIFRAAAGTYKGGIVFPRNIQLRDFVKILGPDVGGHPNVPTAIVDKAADTSATYGISAFDGILLWVQDIKFLSNPASAATRFAQSELIVRFCYYQRRNVHVYGSTVGLQTNIHCTYFNYGGIIDACTSIGISELFHITRSFDTVSSAAQQLTIKNCPVGLKAKENCVGHTDYITFEDCANGLQLHLFSGTNPKGAVFRRCDVGICLINSELHNEDTAVVWDSCTRRVISLGNSSEIGTFGWTGATATPALRTGHRPEVLLFQDYTTTVHTGTTSQTDIFSAALVLRADYYCAQGKRFVTIVKGYLPNGVTLAGTVTIRLRVAGGIASDIVIPAGTAAASGNRHFRLEYECLCTADGDTQHFQGHLVMDGNLIEVQSNDRTITLSDADHSVVVQCVLSNAADEFAFTQCLVYG